MRLGRLLAAISLGLSLALILSLRIADGLSQHLTQLSLGLRSFALGWLPLGHKVYVGMQEGELNPRWYPGFRLLHCAITDLEANSHLKSLGSDVHG
jgi:hypothetical protein